MIKRTVRGVGYNSGGAYKTNEHGRPTKVYSLWQGMIERCYNPKQLIRRPNYVGCTVDERWHDFQVFAIWYDNHPYKDLGYQLDKDILVQGNKLYSPETVCLVPRELNMLFTSATRARGKYPQGVNYYEPLDNYCAAVRANGKSKHLGYFDCQDKAHEVYKKAKEAHVKEMADLWFGNIEPKVYEALMDWKLES